MKLKKWFWGLFFLFAGVSVIVNQMGLLGNVNLLTLVLTIFLIPIILVSIPKLNFGGILFPLAALGILYAEALGIQNFTPWPILVSALFGTIGFSVIFYSSKKHNFSHRNEGFDTIINEQDENTVSVDVHFGGSVKYVNTEDFQKGIFNCSFGALKVYFDQAKIKTDEAVIVLNANCAGIELYIPKSWQIINNVNVTLSGVEEKNYHENSNGPKVILSGNISLSGVEIIYV